MSVHAFHPNGPGGISRCWSGFPDRSSAFGESLKVVRAAGSPCVLHYISCSFAFWHAKYSLLGAFADTKPGGAAAGGESMAGSFHADSRDVVLAGDHKAARRMYIEQVCLVDEEEAARQVASGVCMRVRAVQQFLTVELTRIRDIVSND